MDHVPATSAALAVFGEHTEVHASLAEVDDATIDHLAESIARWWHRAIRIAVGLIAFPAVPPAVFAVALIADGLHPLIAVFLATFLAAMLCWPTALVVTSIGRRVVNRLAQDEVTSLLLADQAKSAVTHVLSRARARGADLRGLEYKAAVLRDELRMARAQARVHERAPRK